jgi:glycosyltransferase involved in cell wall biosynthesis
MRFSIITPSFNQEPFLEANIQSVLSQHSASFEHIIIDGGSTDGTQKILQRHAHLRWISEPDRGQSHALNKGIAMATGDIIGWVNSDDGYLSGAFTEVESVFQDSSISVVYGDGMEVDEDGHELRRIVAKGITAESLVRYWWWKYEYCQPAFFFRRKVLELIGPIDERLYYTMDHDLLIRLIGAGAFRYVPKPLAYFRLHGSSKTGTTHSMVIPTSVWELHRVSMRYWGLPNRAYYLVNFCSFAAGLAWSLLKNLLFLPGSKSRGLLLRSTSERRSED